MNWRSLPLGIVLLLAGVGPTVAGATLEDGAIQGRVVSTDGAGVPGAVVRIEGHGAPAVLVRTDEEGWFRCPRPPSPPALALRVSAPGYRDSESVELGAAEGPPSRLEVVLAAQATEPSPVDVSERAATRPGSRYEADFVDRLPIIGHDYQSVLRLAPGVIDADRDGAFHVHGARATGLQFRLDRGDVTDPVTGLSGKDLNPLVVEQVEVLTTRAPAEYGRAMGGFASVRTRSGGNDFQGRLAVFWRGRFLDGDGADSDDGSRFGRSAVPSRDLRVAAAAGGPMVTDHLWYYAGFESLEAEFPGARPDLEGRTSSEGHYYFGKVSLRAHPDQALRLQIAGDPVTLEGQGLARNTARDAGFEREQGGVAAELAWTATLPSRALLEASVSRLDTELTIEPESRFFARLEPQLRRDMSTGFTLQAAYPCSVPNCSEQFGERRVHTVNFFSGRVNGPHVQRSDERRTHDALRADLSYPIETEAGEHHLRGGFEIGEENLHQRLLTNPTLLDLTVSVGGPTSNRVIGAQVLNVTLLNQVERTASNFHAGFYASDSWRPLQNLVVNVGVRLDREDLDAPGLEPFDPRAERRRAIGLWWAVCEEASRQGIVGSSSNCSPTRPYDGLPPRDLFGALQSFVDRDMDGRNDVATEVAALDLNMDGSIDLQATEREALFKHFTVFEQRQAENFGIRNAHLSPRIGVSWDPASDGRTRVFAQWGRYYDRLRSEAVLGETDPAVRKFVYFPSVSSQMIMPGVLSNRSSLASVSQVDRRLRTPRTDELAVGYERELGAAWSVGATYIRRKASDLLQDVDLNHYTCLQSDEAFGIAPLAVCGSLQGDLETDQFGAFSSSTPGTSSGFPNGLEDLYVASAEFNQVLQTGNFNRSDYEAYEVTAVRRLHRGWQVRGSYLYARGRGEADDDRSPVGNDPALADRHDAALAYDRRHELRFQGVTHLRGRVILGGTIEWASGTSFTIASLQPIDLDSGGNLVERTLLPTKERNDQRNGSRWRLDGRIEKSFTIRRVQAAGFLIAENLLNTDTLTIATVSDDGEDLAARLDFGRRFEIGVILGF